MNDRNPYEIGTPAWQLFECMKSHEVAAANAAELAEAQLRRGADARKRVEQYRAALDALGSKP